MKEHRNSRKRIKERNFKKSDTDLGDNTKTDAKYEPLTKEQAIRLGIAQGKRLKSEILMGLILCSLFIITITLLAIFIL